MQDATTAPQASEFVITAEVEQASQPYIGQWNQLVSTTNWEKGRIICEWRANLINEGAPSAQFTDEAWSRLVGGVTGQHTGRLRRVYQRFGQTHKVYAGLYWSHFHAALDWDDAEMWLEGAVQSRWSVSQMRKQRWETMGEVAGQTPRSDDEISAELDEDFEPAQRQEPIASSIMADYGEIAGPRHEGPDFGDEPNASRFDDYSNGEHSDGDQGPANFVDPVRPFEELADLPDDIADIFERFKLVILKHRQGGWREIACADLTSALDALKQLALSPLPVGEG